MYELMRPATRIEDHLADYLGFLKRSGHNARTVRASQTQLELFHLWSQMEGIFHLDQLSAGVLAAYHHHVCLGVDCPACPWGRRDGREMLTKLRRFLTWLHRHNLVEDDLAKAVPTQPNVSATCKG